MPRSTSPNVRRETNPLIARNRLAQVRVAPYIGKLGVWRSSLVRLRAVGFSRHHTPAERATAAAALAALTHEIALARQDFIREMVDISDLPAVVDFLAALDSLQR